MEVKSGCAMRLAGQHEAKWVGEADTKREVRSCSEARAGGLGMERRADERGDIRTSTSMGCKTPG